VLKFAKKFTDLSKSADDEQPLRLSKRVHVHFAVAGTGFDNSTSLGIVEKSASCGAVVVSIEEHCSTGGSFVEDLLLGDAGFFVPSCG
jgi:hypothetical protein